MYELKKPGVTPKPQAAETPVQAAQPVPIIGSPSSQPPLTVAGQRGDLTGLMERAQRLGTDGAVSAVMREVERLSTRGQLADAATRYETQTGRSLHNDLQGVLGSRFGMRARITHLLGGVDLEWDAFLEQLAYGAGYSNKDDLSDAKGAGPHTNLGQVVKAAGFKVSPVIRGRWGLQFRTATPGPRAIRKQAAMIYRGTEGIRMPWDNPLDPALREGMVDTYIGDVTAMGAGYPQFEANRELIERHAKALGKSMMTGHSLGGALAQIAAARLPQYAAGCVTFAAPGIKTEDAAAMKKRGQSATHYRTLFDIVPSGNSQMAPGNIVTVKRLTSNEALGRWLPTLNPGTTHNNMPVRNLLNITRDSERTDFEKELLKEGVRGPTDDDQHNRAISVPAWIKPAAQDPVVHGGELLASTDASRKTFEANLGYNLLVEYVESKVKVLDPGKVSHDEVRRRLRTLADEVRVMRVRPMSKGAVALYGQMGLAGTRPTEPVGSPIALSPDDAQLVAGRVQETWTAWWPGAGQ